MICSSTVLPFTSYRGANAANAFSVDVDRDGNYARSGACRDDLGTACTDDSDCTTGKCRLNGVSCTDDSDCLGAGNFCDRCMNDEIILQPDLVMPLPPTP